MSGAQILLATHAFGQMRWSVVWTVSHADIAVELLYPGLFGCLARLADPGAVTLALHSLPPADDGSFDDDFLEEWLDDGAVAAATVAGRSLQAATRFSRPAALVLDADAGQIGLLRPTSSVRAAVSRGHRVRPPTVPSRWAVPQKLALVLRAPFDDLAALHARAEAIEGAQVEEDWARAHWETAAFVDGDERMFSEDEDDDEWDPWAPPTYELAEAIAADRVEVLKSAHKRGQYIARVGVPVGDGGGSVSALGLACEHSALSCIAYLLTLKDEELKPSLDMALTAASHGQDAAVRALLPALGRDLRGTNRERALQLRAWKSHPRLQTMLATLKRAGVPLREREVSVLVDAGVKRSALRKHV